MVSGLLLVSGAKRRNLNHYCSRMGLAGHTFARLSLTICAIAKPSPPQESSILSGSNKPMSAFLAAPEAKILNISQIELEILGVTLVFKLRTGPDPVESL